MPQACLQAIRFSCPRSSLFVISQVPDLSPSFREASSRERLFTQLLFKWIPAGARALLLGKARFAVRMAKAQVAVTLTADAEPEAPGNDGDARMERIPLHFPLDNADREACGEMLRSAACDAVVADGLEGAVTPEKLHELVREIELALSPSGTAVVMLDGASSTHTLSPEFVIALFERFGFALAERKSAGDPGSLVSAALVFVRDAARVRARKSLQGLLEDDRKTTTYKLALIKALAEINLANAARVRYLPPADMTAYLVRTKIPDAPHQAAIPMGLIIERVAALYWQIYRAHALNESAPLPAQIGSGRRLEFEEPLMALIRLYQGDWLSFRNDFYLGRLAAGSPRALAFIALAKAVRKAIDRGPVFYAGNSLGDDTSAIAGMAGNRLFRLEAGAGFRVLKETITPDLLDRAAGTFYLPSELWRELNVSAPWLTEAVTIRWAKQSSEFSRGVITPGAVIDIMALPEDVRDTSWSRGLFLERIRTEGLASIWSGAALSAHTLAVDHMIPWSRTHTNDLWNLMPAETKENGRKSDLVPSAACLDQAADRIIRTWKLYEGSPMGTLFRAQAQSTLMGRTLPQKDWEAPMMDALLRSADETVLQYACRRWEPGPAAGF